MNNKNFITAFKIFGAIGYFLFAFLLAATIVVLNIFGPVQALVPLGLGIWLLKIKQFTHLTFIIHFIFILLAYILLIYIAMNFRM